MLDRLSPVSSKSICLNEEKLPSVSGVNSQIIYSSIRPNHLGIYHQTLNGEIKLIGETTRFSTHPIPAPDGQSIVYSSNQAGSQSLFIRNMENGVEMKLTDHPFFEDYPRFNSGYLYFCSDYSGSTHIYRALWEGKEVKMEKAERVTNGRGNDFSFCLSPDGKKIIFSSNREHLEDYQGPQPSSNFQSGCLYKMKIGEPETCKRLIRVQGQTASSWEGTPIYSKDGRFIFYYCSHKGKKQLYHYECATKKTMHLMQTEAEALYPSIYSDHEILFSYQKQSNRRWKIKKMQLDGRQVESVVKKFPQHCWAPQIMPDGSLIFYGTTYLSKISENGGLAHGKGSFIVDQGEVIADEKRVAFKAIRGFFSQVNLKDKKLTYIEDMTIIKRCHLDGLEPEEIFNTAEKKLFVFGLSQALDGSLVTSLGTPFKSNQSDIIYLSPEGKLENLTESFPSARNITPAISKDGQFIVFVRKEERQRKHLYLMRRNQSDLKQLTFGERDNVFPSISPCGKFVAFSSTSDGKTYQLCLLDLRSEHIKILTEGFVDMHAAFSPDSQQLVFTSNRGGIKAETPLSFFFNPQPYGDNYILDINTGKIQQVTSSPYEDSTPTWIEAIS